MLRIEFPEDALEEQIEKVQVELKLKQSDLLDKLGDDLEELARVAFERLSQGAQAAGLSWDQLSHDYLARKIRGGFPRDIGIRTGKMRRTLSHKTALNTVSTRYNSKEANYFAKRRPLLPKEDKLPQEWSDRLDSQVVEWADDIMDNYFE
jgi:hypothetical protein